jgi:WD40 repeat protein/energy-coupling factor transporter ATP-binding protein EcfA2
MSDTIALHKNPFKFLEAYSKTDRKLFTGREQETEQLYEMAHNGDLILVVGESGVGKTSLVQCGLANRFLKTDWLDVWVRRGDEITSCLHCQLIKTFSENGGKKLKGDESITTLIHLLYLDSFKPVYLIFDQFEEIYTLGSPEERETFYKQIEEIVEARISCKIILVVREEYLNKLSDFEKIVPELFFRRLNLKRMERSGAQQVIKKAAAGDRIHFEPTEEIVINAILDECMKNSSTVQLPYLQVFLDALWRKAAENDTNVITFSEQLVSEIGNIEDVLKNFLTDRVSELSRTEEEKEDLVWLFLQHFVVDNKAAEENAKRPSREKEISGVPPDKVKRWLVYFEKKRILRHLDTDQYELAHESLVPIVLEHKIVSVRPRLIDPPIKGNPYKGLASYDEDDRYRFYGRTKITDQLYRKISEERIVAVVGPSGAGKSSIIKAGLLPRLKEDGYLVISKRPGEYVDKRIAEIKAEISKNKDQKKFVLYIDQYEELITRCEDRNARERFIDYLRSIADLEQGPDGQDIRIILSIRSDFEPQFDFFFPNHWGKGRVPVPSFTPEEIREIIVEPAYQAGLEFQPAGLVNIIADEVARSAGSLPLLSYTLSQMYTEYSNRPEKDGFLTEKDYNLLGGVVGGLRTRANEVYDQSDAANQRTIRNVILRMVSLGAGELAGKRVNEPELIYSDEEENRRVKSNLNKFIDKRLIISGKDDLGNLYYEPAHDSLVRSWEKLWDWINSHGKEILLLQIRLTEAVHNFQNDQLLWHDNSRLNQLEEIVKSNDNWLNKAETEFVQKSIQKKEAIEKSVIDQKDEQIRLTNEKLRWTRRSRQTLILGIAAAVLLAAFSTLQYYEKAKKEKIANQASKYAQDQQKIAKTETQNALEQQKIAQGRTKEAERLQGELKANATLLMKQKTTSDSLRRVAERNALMAKQNETQAERNARQARESADLASSRLIRANEATSALDREKKDVEKKRDSIAKLLEKYEVVKKSGKWLKYAQTIETNEPALAYQCVQKAFELDSTDNEIRTYRTTLSQKRGYYETMILPGKRSLITPDGNYLLTIDYGKVNCWSLDGRKIDAQSFEVKDYINKLKFSPNGDMLVVGETTVHLRKSNGSLVAFKVDKPTFATLLNNDERQVLIANKDFIRIGASSGGGSMHILADNRGIVINATAYQNFITVQTDKGVYVYDSKREKLITELPVSKNDGVVFLLPTGDGILLVKNNVIYRYNAKLKKTDDFSTMNFSRSYYSAKSAYFSDDASKVLITLNGNSYSNAQQKGAAYNAITVFVDLKSMQANLFAEEDLNKPVFSPDGKKVLVSSLGKVIIYKTNGDKLGAFGNNTLFSSWDFLPDNAGIVTSSLDDRTKLWIYGTPAALKKQGKLATFSPEQLKETKIDW